MFGDTAFVVLLQQPQETSTGRWGVGGGDSREQRQGGNGTSRAKKGGKKECERNRRGDEKGWKKVIKERSEIESNNAVHDLKK